MLVRYKICIEIHGYSQICDDGYQVLDTKHQILHAERYRYEVLDTGTDIDTGIGWHWTLNITNSHYVLDWILDVARYFILYVYVCVYIYTHAIMWI